MNLNWVVKSSLLAAMIALAGFGATGCGGPTEQDAQAVEATPPVDPRFATAEEMLAHYNSLTTREPIDIRAVLELIYAENDLQQRLVNVIRAMIALDDLDGVMIARFGESWSGEKTRMSSADNPAKMIKNDGPRAKAEYIDSRSKKKTVQFVRVGERWWVSGYTIEHDSEMRSIHQEIGPMERVMPAMAAVAPEIQQQIVAGQIRSAQAARLALMTRAMQNNPNLAEDFGRIANAAGNRPPTRRR